MKKIAYIFSVMLAGLASCKEVSTVKVKATEEDGTPIEGVDATVTFLGYSGTSTQRVTGKTDFSGAFQAQGSPELRMFLRLEKEGYYKAKSDRLSRKKDHDMIYVLKKIKKPIPLYAKRLQVVAPVIGSKFAYDCQAGDWVKPHGNGKVKDLIFKVIVHRNKNKYTDYHHELVMSFSNEEDGFVKFKQDEKSLLKSPYQTPTQVEYVKSFSYFKKREVGEGAQTNGDPLGGYFFRLRTRLNEQGEIISCHYAKAYGDIPDLKIYFNPTSNDRNLEFDPSRNLFSSLDPTEQVREP